MNNKSFINLTPGSTFLHKLNGATKVKLFVGLIVYVTMSFDLPIILPLFVVSIIGLISLKPNWKLVSTIAIIVFLMNAVNIFIYYLADPQVGAIYTNDSTVLYTITEHYVLTRGTLWYFLLRMLKMYTSFLVSLVFIMSITPSEIAAGCTSLGLPYKFGTIIEIAFRYIPDISRDYEAISVSMQCRGLELDKKKTKPLERLKQYVYILIPLVITSFDRVGNIANAMDLRGFGKHKKRTYYAEHPATKADKLISVIAIIVFVIDIVYILYKTFAHRETQMWIYW